MIGDISVRNDALVGACLASHAFDSDGTAVASPPSCDHRQGTLEATSKCRAVRKGTPNGCQSCNKGLFGENLNKRRYLASLQPWMCPKRGSSQTFSSRFTHQSW